MNLLLIPWPFEVLVDQFRETADAAARLPKDFGFFTFASDSEGRSENLTALVEALYKEAERKLGRIDGVVLPELSIADEQFSALRQTLLRSVSSSAAWVDARPVASGERTK
jgi:hypothetical protein